MPIFDIQAQAEPTFPRLGVIRKGAPKGDKRPGKDLEYFRLDDAPDVKEAYLKLYGTDKPREMGIFLPFDDLDRVFRAFHELYSAGTLICQGDGERVVYLRHHETGELLVRNGVAVRDHESGGERFVKGQIVPCPGLAHDLYPRCARCKPHGYLMAIIPEVRRFGYYEFKTTSIYDIRNITSNLRAIMLLNNGRLTGVPLVIRRTPMAIPMPGTNGKRIRRTKWLLTIEAAPGWVDMMQKRWQALETGSPTSALEGPRVGEVVDDEPSDLEIVEEMEAGWADGAEEQPEGPPVPPADLEALAKARAYFARADDNENATPKQAQYLASLLEEALGGGEVATAERHAWLEAVCGVTSCKDLGKRQANRMIDFLTQGNGRLDPLAAKRVRAVMRAVRMEQGQQQLPLQSPEDIEIVREAAEEQGQREMPVDDPRPADVRAAAQVL